MVKFFLILWCHSKVLKAELKVDKKAVVKGVGFLLEGVKTTNRCFLHPPVVGSVGLLFYYQAFDPWEK